MKRSVKAEPERSVEMAMQQDDWPMWPLLPVKRVRDSGRDHGSLRGTMDGLTPPVVWINLSPFGQMGTVHTMEYPNLIALFNDGWRVD